MHRFLITGLVAAALIPAAGASAQSCLGLQPLTTHPTNVTVTGQFTDGAKSLDGRFGFGSSIAFGGIAAQVVSYDNIDGTSKGIYVDGGLSYLAGASRNVSICPVGTLGYTFNPDGGTTANSHTTVGQAGLAIGANFGSAPSMRLIPFGSLQLRYSRYDSDYQGTSLSDSDTIGLIGGGLGIVLTDAVSLRPSVTVPLKSGYKTTWGIGISFALGGR
ncbi:MAG: hypothetical protein ABI910_15655 [Gemmatimonadota bacterium]